MITKADAKELCLLSDTKWKKFKKAATLYFYRGGLPPANYLAGVSDQDWAKYVVTIDKVRSARVPAEKPDAKKRKAIYMRKYMRQYRQRKSQDKKEEINESATVELQ